MRIFRWAKPRPISRSALILTISLALILLVFCWHLSSPAPSPAETASLHSARTAHQLLNNPVNAPHQLFEYLLQRSNHASLRLERFVSVAYFLIFIACFYYIARNWFGKFSARLGALLLAFTPLCMLVARSAGTDVMYLFPLTAVAGYMWFVRSKTMLNTKLVLLGGLAALALYEPGGPLFLLAGIIYVWPLLRKLVTVFNRKALAAAVIVFLILIAPLIAAIVKQPSLAKAILLVPAHVPTALDFLKWSAWQTLALPFKSGQHNYYQLGRTAILDITQVVLVAFGVFALWSRATSKTYLLGAATVLAILFSALNQSYTMLLFCLPALMVIATAGLRYLHLEWTGVFPRNPLPRGLALTLLFTLVGLHVLWGIHYSLTAWPHSFGLFA